MTKPKPHAAAEPELFAPEKPAAGKTKTKAAEKATPKPAPPKPQQALAKVEPQAQPPAQHQERSIMQVIADAASNPLVDVAKMRELLNMKREIDQDEERRAFIADFMALQAEMPSIRRDGKIEIRKKDGAGERTGAVQQATPYATFENIHRVIKPLLTKHGFNLSFATEPGPGERITVRGILDHRRGHSRTSAFPLPAETSGSKNNVQGWGSAQSYGRRYVTIALLNIVSHAEEDRDLDGNDPQKVKPTKGKTAAQGDGFPGDDAISSGPPVINQDQQDKLRDALEDAELGIDRFCGKYRIDKIGDLPAKLYAEAIKAIAEYKAQHKGGR